VRSYKKKAFVPLFLLILFIYSLPLIVSGLENAGPQNARTAPLDEKLPLDPNLRVGQFENGLRYYIRENKKPENRGALRLVVNAGSILEDDDQLGLAHFVEHMAFNGTKNFAKHELIEFMESIGMRFGPGLNAYTGFDETVYVLEIPTESPEVMEKAVQILEDWSHGLSFEPEEIDKERGVIVEEWRSGLGAYARMRDKQFPILFKGSRYADRLTIGKKEIIENFDYDALRRFYRDWYRPDLMAVIAVGDFDASKVEVLIQNHFASLPETTQPRQRTLYSVPDNEDTLFAIATDKEATGTSVAVYHKLPPEDIKTVGDYRRLIAEQLYNRMLNQRFSELAQQKDPPFLFASSAKGSLVRSKEVYALSARVRDEGIERGLKALLIESARASRYGFTSSELEREKTEALRSIERSYAEREKNDSSLYVSEYIRNFLQDEPIPGIEYEFELYKRFIPVITLEEVNRIGKEWITEKNRVIMVNAPEKEGLSIPTEEDLQKVIESIGDLEISPYEDKVSQIPLMPEVPKAGEITEVNFLDEWGITEWKLSNGVRVVLKPTDFKEDEILFQATSPGGISMAGDEDFVPARTAVQVIGAGGLGEFNAIDLGKKLAGKVASARPLIGDYEEGLIGGASPKDLETLFQLIYLRFTAPRADVTMFDVVKNRLKAMLENRKANPMLFFIDKLRGIVTQNNPRAQSLTVEQLDQMDLERSYAFYRDRFADASGFTFIFVGNIDLEAVKPLAKRYLASLPSLYKDETWRDVGVRPPKGVVKEKVEKGVEPQSQVAIVFTGPFVDTQENRNAIRALGLVLQTRLRNKIREDLGGTYGIMASPSYDIIPEPEYSFTFNFGTDPERVDELTGEIFQELDHLKNEGITAEELRDTREAMYRDFETGIKQNGWLLTQLNYRYQEGEDVGGLFNYDKTLQTLSAEKIQEAAKTYLDMENYVQVTLFPGKKQE
jgi:zinc protease